MGVTWFRLEQSGLCACRTEQFRYAAHTHLNANNTDYRPAYAVA